MDYRFIHPLYTNKEPQAAIEYLINTIKDHIDVGEEDVFGNTIDPSAMEVTKIIAASSLVQNVYGVNAIDIANFFKTQEYFYKYYADSILRYCNILGLENAVFIKIRPGQFIPQILGYHAEHSKNFTPLNMWNPKEIWFDYGYKDDDHYRNIMNPLNNLDHVYLMLNDMKNHRELMTNLIHLDTKFNSDEERQKMYNINNLIYKLLPAKNMRGLLFFVKTLHKYL